MKFNKIFLGIGVMGLALASCSDDVEYTPAEPVNTPPVYFSMNDATTIDLEEDATYFTMKAYRQNTSDNTPGKMTMTLSSENGTDVSGVFKIGDIVVKDVDAIAGDEVNLGDILDENDEPTGQANVFVPAATQFVAGADGKAVADVTVNFPAGSGEKDCVVYFGGVSNLEQMVNYTFDAVAAGESSPYFITSIDYNVSYTPWETITEGPVILRDNSVLAPAGGGMLEFEVVCQQHPIKKNFFRLLHPYLDSPYGANFYVLDPADPNYLYINAANESEVFFADKNGDYSKLYNTGLQMYNGVDGPVYLGCNYCYNKLEENLEWEGLTVPYTSLSGAGEYKNGRINFGTNLVVLLPGIANVWSAKDWTLVFPWAASEWEELGIGEYTDGFITQFYAGVATIPAPYPVTVERHLETPGLYRIVGPYSYGVWPSEFATPWDVTYNMVIDCQDPNFVVIEDQTVFEDEDGELKVMNAAFAYMNYLQQPLTKDEVIEEGLNDIFDEATGTVTIMHPFLRIGNEFYYLPEETDRKGQPIWNTPAKLVLPTEEAEGGEAAPAKVAKSVAVSKVDFTLPSR